jgi:hypothetical protein
MKKISLLINVEVPDDYEFEDGYEDGYKLMEYVNKWDLDYQIMCAKEL